MAYEGMGGADLLLSLPQAWLLSAPAYSVSSNVLPRQGALLCAVAGEGQGHILCFLIETNAVEEIESVLVFVQF